MKILAIIPARSGSKGIKDKNIKEICGKPLMAYTIEAAIASKQFEEIMVSTDSEEYASIAKKYGAKVPFLRNEATSSDTASSWDMVKEVLDGYKKQGFTFDSFMLLQPTSPLRTSEDIIGAIKEYHSRDALAVVSVCEMEHSPVFSNTLPSDCSMAAFFREEYINKRRQDLELYFRLNGAIYLADINTFFQMGSIYKKKCYAFVMKQMHSIDIDTELDFLIAEAIIRKNGGTA